MKKLMSLFLVLAMVLSCSVPAFATSADDMGETIIIDGSQYTLKRTVTDMYSQAILKNSSGKIIENYIYYFVDSILVNVLTNQTLPLTSTIIDIENIARPLLGDESKYVYSHTDRTNFTLVEMTVVGVATAISALVPYVAIAVLTQVVGYAIAKGLSSLEVEQEVYKYWEKEDGDNYLYTKTITRIYGSDNTLIGGPWTNYNKFRQR